MRAQHVAAGLVTLRKGVLSESVVLLLVDSEETAKSRAAKSFEVVIEHVKYGALAPGSGAGVCTVTMGEHLKIKDVTDSQVFQVRGDAAQVDDGRESRAEQRRLWCFKVASCAHALVNLLVTSCVWVRSQCWATTIAGRI